jgi:hypothetical protein
MSAFPGSPCILKAGLVPLDPDTFAGLPNAIVVLVQPRYDFAHVQDFKTRNTPAEANR